MAITKEHKSSFRKTNLFDPRKTFFSVILNRQLFEGMKRRNFLPTCLPASSVPISPLSSEDEETTSELELEMDSKTGDLLVSSMLKRPFRTVCNLLLKLDENNDYDLISETIMHFSLKIYGLPECCREDLPLAVYFFIEDMFDIQSKIELCVKLEEEGKSSVIGVVFETIQMKYDILTKNFLLEGTEIQMSNNTDLGWIIEGLV